MKKTTYIVILFHLFCSSIFSQNDTSRACGGVFMENDPKSMNCTKNSQDYIYTYRKQSSYIPGTNEFVDEIVIPFNIIIVADDNGKHGAYKDLEAFDNEEFKEIWVNRAYQNTKLPSDPVPGYPSTYWLETTKIKFEINEVYFYDSTEFFYADYWEQNSQDKILDYHFQKNPETKDFVNCFIANKVASYGGVTITYNGIPNVFSIGRKSDNMDENTIWGGRYWYWGNHLPHELGHALGLYHTYSGMGAETMDTTNIDYLSDVFFEPNFYEIEDCPKIDDDEDGEDDPWRYDDDFCTNNLMSGHPVNFFISPFQAGRMHRNLRSKNIRNFAYGYSSKKHYISSDEVWDFTYKSYNDIVIKPGASLTITCKLEMVSESKIIVEQGGKLIIDEGIITSAKSSGKYGNDFWQGMTCPKIGLHKKV